MWHLRRHPILRSLTLTNCAAVFFILATVLLAHAQDQPSADALATGANAAYQLKSWDKAEPLYERLTQQQPQNARYWYRLGICRQRSQEHAKAIEAFHKAQALGTPPAFTAYGLAEAYGSSGQQEKALESLTEAVKQGYAQPDDMSSDPDLQAIRQDQRFAGLLEQTKRNQKPCAYTAENRQFDFWLGDWDVVTTRDNAPAGTSHIEKTIGDCVIWENWTSLSSSYTGKSYNTYNTNQKRWEQFWVDNVGGMVHFYGALKDHNLDFYTDDVPQPDGSKLRRHLQFFNLGAEKVRQFSQGSRDEGKTWFVEYDLTYLRKN